MMKAPNYAKSKKALKLINDLADDSKNIWIIHYSCESFYETIEGKSPRIASIAVRNLQNGQTRSFSIQMWAERQSVNKENIMTSYDSIERIMLEDYFNHLRMHPTARYVHWNMRDSNYGFAALEHRLRVLGGDPFVIDDDKKFDLSRIFIDVYGISYISHPRLEKLMLKNNIAKKDFLTGEEEARVFIEKQFYKLHQSTLRKADVLSNLFERARNGQLKTNNKWWIFGYSRILYVGHLIADNKWVVLIGTLASIIGLILAVR